MDNPAASGATWSSSKPCSPNPDLTLRRTFSLLARCVGAVAATFLLARCGHSGPSGTSPVVAAIDPNHGPAGGGTAIHITGDHFAAGAVVNIGGALATDVIGEASTSVTPKTGVPVPGASGGIVNPGGGNGTPAGGVHHAGGNAAA